MIALLIMFPLFILDSRLRSEHRDLSEVNIFLIIIIIMEDGYYFEIYIEIFADVKNENLLAL